MKIAANYSDMELMAEHIREKLNLKSRPIRNMCYLLQNLGIVVTSYAEDVGHMDAISHMPVLSEGRKTKSRGSGKIRQAQRPSGGSEKDDRCRKSLPGRDQNL